MRGNLTNYFELIPSQGSTAPLGFDFLRQTGGLDDAELVRAWLSQQVLYDHIHPSVNGQILRGHWRNGPASRTGVGTPLPRATVAAFVYKHVAHARRP